jgi:general secretion pathway protein A
MTQKKLLALFGLKWNPFSPDLPTEAILKSKAFEHFCWRIESLALEGGFAMVTGDPGLGKSVTLRSLSEHLSKMREITVGAITRPQSGVGDFYRELGSLFAIELRGNNRWGGYRMMRERWQTHIDSTLLRPVILIDEAQEMPTQVLSELRLMVSHQFDSQILLTVILAGDNRLIQRFRSPELVPLGTRIRTRLHLETNNKQELITFLKESCARAGNAELMSNELMETLAEHSAGNPRILTTLASEILSLGSKKELSQLTAGLYLEAFPQAAPASARKLRA